jgi:hypothetical protein
VVRIKTTFLPKVCSTPSSGSRRAVDFHEADDTAKSLTFINYQRQFPDLCRTIEHSRRLASRLAIPNADLVVVAAVTPDARWSTALRAT